MKAIVYDKYGPPEVLILAEVPKPVPQHNEVLIKVHAASINSWDWDMVKGEPIVVRMWGLLKPRFKIPGADIAGVVEAVGGQVKKWKPGDEVFCDIAEYGWGGFAEYACAPGDQLARKPKTMTFEQAAATPQAGLMALQSIRDKGQLKSNQKVLLNGAGGGVGTFGVQLAKLHGAEVTCVDSASKLDMLRSLGADHVIDYKQKDFTEDKNSYDLIIDVVANRSLFDYKRALKPGGAFIMIGGTTRALLQAVTVLPWLILAEKIPGLKSNKKLGVLGYKSNLGLDYLSKLFEEGKVTPVIDKCFPLSETSEAFRYYATGKVKGKVIINIV
ncbi:MAG: NAD(P)-dependent alcohol dehydrogenase [Bacteroidota bacterium]